LSAQLPSDVRSSLFAVFLSDRCAYNRTCARVASQGTHGKTGSSADVSTIQAASKFPSVSSGRFSNNSEHILAAHSDAWNMHAASGATTYFFNFSKANYSHDLNSLKSVCYGQKQQCERTSSAGRGRLPIPIRILELKKSPIESPDKSAINSGSRQA
jgi:hypothetical protein